jgi:two-component system response regulator FlrC
VSDVLVIEPDTALHKVLERCADEAGFRVVTVAEGHEPVAIALVDVADAAGIEAVSRLARDGTFVIAMGGAAPRRLAIDALRAGAVEFLRKPFDLHAFERALAAADRRVRRGAPRLALASEDARMLQLVRAAETAARTCATLQIVGEVGTGRRRLARFVHAASRREGACLTLGPDSCGNAAAALRDAADGTLLVEEPGLFPPLAQEVLLRALAARVPASRRGSARIVAVCDRPLRGDRRVRPELRLRLDVLSLVVPPLRERPADVARLARHFAERAAGARGVAAPRLGQNAIAALCGLPLPGNAAELASLMERAAVLFAGRDVDVAALLDGCGAAPAPGCEGSALDLGRLERAAVERALSVCRGNRTHAARALGISVRTLRNKLRDYATAE